MTPRRPTCAATQVTPERVVDRSETHVAGRDTWTLHLRVAFQAEVAVAFDEHLGIDGPVRDMADRAAFAHRVVLVLRFYEEMKIEEIARLLCLSPGTVKSRLHYAILEMQKRMPSGLNLFGSNGTKNTATS